MKSFGNYISKYLVSFAGLVLILLVINGIAFSGTFYGIITKDYSTLSPQNMLETAAASASLEGISENASERLRNSHIWSVYLDMEGTMVWELEAPDEIPKQFTIDRKSTRLNSSHNDPGCSCICKRLSCRLSGFHSKHR